VKKCNLKNNLKKSVINSIMPEWGILIGGFIRWLLKFCKTKLRDEIEGNLDATWGRTYDIENYIIGIITVVIFGGIIIWLAF
jgi:hypothetical protein